jgi:hypothetical protein
MEKFEQSLCSFGKTMEMNSPVCIDLQKQTSSFGCRRNLFVLIISYDLHLQIIKID